MHVQILGPVAQQMIHQDDGEHGLRDGRRADADAGVVTAVGDDLGRVTVDVDAAPGQAQAGRGLQEEIPPNVPPA